MRYRARGSALLAAASLFVVATASPEAFAEERTLADTLRAAHARVIAGDASVAADLAVLESSADARPVADVVAYLAAKVRAAANPAAATDELRQLLARYSTSSVATRAAADLVELAPEGEDPGEIRALVGKYAVIGAAPRKDIARLLASAGARLGKMDPATASDLLTRARKAAPGSDVAKEAALTVHRVWSANTSSAPHDAESIFEEVKLAARDSSVEEQRFWIDRFLDRYRHDPRKTDVLLLRAQGIARSTSRQAAAEWLEARAKTEASAPARARLLFAAATHRWNANEDALALARFEQVVALATGV